MYIPNKVPTKVVKTAEIRVFLASYTHFGGQGRPKSPDFRHFWRFCKKTGWERVQISKNDIFTIESKTYLASTRIIT